MGEVNPQAGIIGMPGQCPKCYGWVVPGGTHECRDPWTHYVFLSWREALAQSQRQITDAYRQRAELCRNASAAGLSYREIGEGLGLSAAGVQKIIGRGKASLDDPVAPKEVPDA